MNTLQDLIVSRPKSQSWIVSSPPNLLLNLLLNVEEEFFGWWIDAIAEHEIIEEHDAFSWSEL